MPRGDRLLTSAGSEYLTTEALGKNLCIFRVGEAERHEVAVIAAQRLFANAWQNENASQKNKTNG
jgi:hypothetical protein